MQVNSIDGDTMKVIITVADDFERKELAKKIRWMYKKNVIDFFNIMKIDYIVFEETMGEEFFLISKAKAEDILAEDTFDLHRDLDHLPFWLGISIS